MNSKSLILLGLGAGALYTYFCISTHKDRLYKELNPSAVMATDTNSELTESQTVQNEPIKEEIAPIVQQIVVKEDNASFSFANKEPYTFKALLDKDASKSEIIKQINEWCQTKACENDIQFVENVKKEAWSTNALAIVSYIIENNISDGSISIKDNVISVTGEVKDASDKERLEKLLTAFNPLLQVNNEISIVEIPTEESNESLPTTTVDTTETPTVTEEASTDTDTDKAEKLAEAQAEIDTLLQNSVINFKLNSSTIVPSSQKILNNIIKIVNDLNIKVNLDISGHTDASGSASYNKKLSQKRAESVKDYLFEHNINARKLASIGYGEEKFIFDPNDKRNRRVEIYLTKGE